MTMIFYIIFLFIFSFLILKFLTSRFACYLFPSYGARCHLFMGEHQNKKHTPKYGGLAFFLAPIFLIFKFGYSCQVCFIVISSISSGLIGLWDDFIKSRNGRGIVASQKFFSLFFFSLLAALYVYFFDSGFCSRVGVFGYNLDIGWLYVFWAAFVIVSCANAVNLTDGIDGLAAGQVIIILFGLSVVFGIEINEASRISICFISCILIVFFIFFNKNPAKIFMGDVGSLFLGGYISSIFLYEKKEWFLPLFGAFIVLEAASVILQCFSYRVFGRRIFLCAPFHHDLEKRGWSENSIVFGSILFSYIIIGIVFFVRFFFLTP
jgi:phospho-N-acetylmuramoyl-pentapeptide-transferase